MKTRKKSKLRKLLPPAATPTRLDPTRTLTLRRQFASALKQPYARLKLAIYDLVVTRDAFGKRPIKHDPFTLNSWQPISVPIFVSNADSWQFQPPSEQVKGFERWLRTQLDMQTQPLQDVLQRYVALGFAKGAGRAFDDATRQVKDQSKQATQGRLEWYQGTRDEFLRSAFNQPETVDKLKLLVERGLRDVENVNEATRTQMLRVLADGLTQGKSPDVIARDLNKVLDGTAKVRAEAVAKTEIIRAHAEGQLEAFDKLGISHVGAAVEWTTAGDGKVCNQCKPLQGIVLTTKEARGMLPRHIGCRCAWVPAITQQPGQKRTKSSIEQALKASMAKQPKKVVWKPGSTIASKRPESLL